MNEAPLRPKKGDQLKRMSFAIASTHQSFWEKNPALLFGLSLLLGTSSYLFWSFPWNWIFPFFWAIYLIFLRRIPPLVLLIGGIVYAFFIFSDLPTAESGYFSCSSLQPYQSPFTKSLIYKGILTVGAKRAPCTIHTPFAADHPKADSDYILKGQLKRRGENDYLFKAKEWIPVPNTWSFAELRFQTKEWIRKFLDKKLHKPKVASFLGSLLTGDVEDRALRYEFGKLGLQHILAISGFHFAILISFCSFFLSLFLPSRWKIAVLLVAVNIYFIFVGALPAVQRSYLIALFFLTGKLLKRSASPLNLLGAALCVEVLLDPLVTSGLGFQLSFLSCAGILLLRPLFLPLTLRLFPKHNPFHLNLLAKHGYFCTAFLRESIAITLAVNTAILPLLLLHYHSFPLLSFLYNLFFPLLVGGALFLTLLSLLAFLVLPPLSAPFFWLTDFLTSLLLEMAAYPPLFLDYSIRFNSISAWMIPFYLFALFCICIKNAIGAFSESGSYDPLSNVSVIP